MPKSTIKYKSKVDIWLVVLIEAIILISISPLVFANLLWLAAILGCLFVLSTLYPLYNIYYLINENTIQVKCGFIFNREYNISQITKIAPTKSALSAPAASLDRIEISVNNLKYPLIISPSNKIKFVTALKLANPQIKIADSLLS